MFKKNDMSSVDGVAYRKAKLWQIILYAANALCGSSVFMLINQASYAASIGFGVSTAVIGLILTATRILDAITDPLFAFIYDRVNTKFGKLRILIMTGFFIEAVALSLMFDFFVDKGFGVSVFVILYVIYVIGYTIINMTIQTIPPMLTNDPKQRPAVGVWATSFNYLVPMVVSILLNVFILRIAGGQFNESYLRMAVKIVVFMGLIGNILCCIGISAIDKPENFRGTKKTEPLKIKDMIEVLRHNKPLQSYIVAAASDKVAQVTASQSIIGTLLYGIMIGNMGMSTILGMVSMLPAIIFAIFGAKYTGKHGSKKAIVDWTVVCMVLAAILTVFFLVVNPATIAKPGITMGIYVILNLALNGCKMCVSTANASFMADTIDYELDRSGRYIPAVVSGVYSLIDKIISSFGAVIATTAIAAIGYTQTVPQPGEPSTAGIVAIALSVTYGLPIVGWIVTLIAMRKCQLTKEEMVGVQKRIDSEKQVAQKEFFEAELNKADCY